MDGVYLNGDTNTAETNTETNTTETNTLSNKVVLIDDEKIQNKDEFNDEQLNILKKDNTFTESNVEHNISNSSNDDSDDSGILNGSYDLDDKTDISNSILKDVSTVDDVISQIDYSISERNHPEDKYIDDKKENVKTENESIPNGIAIATKDKEDATPVDATSSSDPIVLSNNNDIDLHIGENDADIGENKCMSESRIKSVDDVSLTESYVKISLEDSSDSDIHVKLEDDTDSDITSIVTKQVDLDLEDEKDVSIEPTKGEQIKNDEEITNGTDDEMINKVENEDIVEPPATVENISNVDASNLDTSREILVIDLTEDDVTSEVVSLIDDENNEDKSVIVIDKIDDVKSAFVEVSNESPCVSTATPGDTSANNGSIVPGTLPVVINDNLVNAIKSDDVVEDSDDDRLIIDENINSSISAETMLASTSEPVPETAVEETTDISHADVIQDSNIIATETSDDSEYNPVGKFEDSSISSDTIDEANQTSAIGTPNDKPPVVETPQSPTKNDESIVPVEEPKATPEKETPNDKPPVVETPQSPTKKDESIVPVEEPKATPEKETPNDKPPVVETPQSPTKNDESIVPVEEPKATPEKETPNNKPPVVETPQSPTKKDDSFEELDILGNGLLRKKIILKGNGKETRPVKGNVVTVRCEGRIANGTFVDKHQNLKFILGDEDVIQAFDLAVALMEDKEVATVYTDARYAYGVHGRQDTAPPIPPNAHLTYEIEILSIMEGLDLETMTNEERIINGDKKRTRGNELYGKEEYSASINAYKRGIKYLDGTDDEDVMNMKIKCLNNLSAAQLKVKAYKMAIQSLDTVLQFEPENVKALFRKGKCLEGLKKEEDALEFIRKASMLDPSNKSILQELGRLRSKVAVTHQKEKAIYQKMFNPKKEGKLTKEEEDANWSFRITQAVVGVLGLVAGLLWYKHR